MFARNVDRWLVCFALAGALHCSALLGRGCVHWDVAAPKPRIEAAVDAIDVRLIPDLPKIVAEGAPGGGSIEPRAGSRVSAPEQRVKPSARARLVDRAVVRQERALAGDHREDVNEPQPFATDMLASDFAEAAEAVRPHAARRQILADKPQIEPQGAPDAALLVARRSALAGTGPGVHGGSGGLGRGNGTAGVVEQQFAFGGPTGAFRADVCFVEPTVRRLTDITSCVPVATFFTSVLNVAVFGRRIERKRVTPRRFDQGFPGLGPRTEWFAIKYRGKFRVTAEDSYTFRLLSDDGARLEIDGQPVLNNDGQHMPTAVSKNVRLDPGMHEFFVFYYQGPPAFLALQLFVKRFAHDEQLFGPVI